MLLVLASPQQPGMSSVRLGQGRAVETGVEAQ
jgi:hypothetical protein